MITTIVKFKPSLPLTGEKAREAFLRTAPEYRNIPGLVRKYYIVSEDGETAGGVYLWNSREDAERVFTDEWKKTLFKRYGAEPSVSYFKSAVIVDNATGEITTNA